MTTSLLADEPLAVVNVGVETFTRSVRDAGGAALQLDWRPVGDGDPQLAWLLALLAGDADDSDSVGARIDRANARAVERIVAAQPVLQDVALHARDVWPDMGRTLLHAGAPIEWSRMCGPMRGAAIGAVLYEGWADAPATAEAMLARGEIPFAQCHDFGAVGPMAGIISSSMPLFVVENRAYGNKAYSNMSEGIGRVLRFGANGPEVIERLRWIERVLAPTLQHAVRALGGIELAVAVAVELVELRGQARERRGFLAVDRAVPVGVQLRPLRGIAGLRSGERGAGDDGRDGGGEHGGKDVAIHGYDSCGRHRMAPMTRTTPGRRGG